MSSPWMRWLAAVHITKPLRHRYLTTSRFYIGNSVQDVVHSFQRVPTSGLVLAAVILKACQLQWLTNKLAPFYIRLSARYPRLCSPANAVVRRTFFRYFCGGEDSSEITQTISKLSSLKVGPILDAAMEEDLKEVEEYPHQLIIPNLAVSDSSYFPPEKLRERYNIVADSIDIASTPSTDSSTASNGGTPAAKFVACKLTCLIPPGLLYQLTLGLDHLIHHLQKGGPLVSGNTSTYLGELRAKFQQHPERLALLDSLEAELKAIEESHPSFSPRNAVFSLKYSTVLSYYLNILLPLHYISPPEPEQQQQLLENLTNSLNTCVKLAEYSSQNGVSLMIDAEQSYFQTAIHFLTFNVANTKDAQKESIATIFGTYQMYLKEGFEQLKSDCLLYNVNNTPFALKVVRGAYMHSERARAARLGLPTSAICETIEDTHANYDSATQFMMNAVLGHRASAVCFATHNPNSVETIINWVMENAHTASHIREKVMVGQLLGMADHVTLSVAQSGYVSAFKYVPVGPLGGVLPYLFRRAQENSTLLGRADAERRQILRVLLRRLVPVFGTRTPSTTASSGGGHLHL